VVMTPRHLENLEHQSVLAHLVVKRLGNPAVQ
jgi:hypothetical protein